MLFYFTSRVNKLMEDTDRLCACHRQCRELDAILAERGQEPFAVKEFNSRTSPMRGFDENVKGLGDLPMMVDVSTKLLKNYRG